MSNTSGSALTNVALRATLPAGVTINSVSNGGTDLGSGEVEWTVASLAAGAALHGEIVVTVASLSTGDIVDLDVVLTHDSGVEMDNSAQFAVSVVESAQPLTVSIAATPTPVTSGGTLSYTITVTNVSALPVDAVMVQYRVPAELSFNDTAAVEPDPTGCSALVNGLVCDPREEALWNIGTLAAGGVQVITIDATVAAGLVNGILINVPIRTTATGLIDTTNLQHTTVIQN
jgi:uncharacterized repeat protein (TIGR01451 family)